MSELIIDIPKAGKYKYFEEVPPVVPSSIIDNAVKGSGGYQFNYTGDWAYGTNVPGWNDGTLSYSTNGQVSIKVDGTGVELITEVGPTHGIVGIQVDSEPEVMIDLYAPQFTQQVKVWEKSLQPGPKTIKLRSTGTKNPLATNTYAILDYIKVYTPQPIVDPVPPVNPDIITVNPGQSIKAAVENASSGKKVKVLAGVYQENIVNVPIGVSIEMAGSDKVFIDHIGTHTQQSETAIFQLKSTSQVDGNQTISGFTIRGRYTANGGVIVNNRNNVKGWDIKVVETTYFGVWLKGHALGDWSYLDLYNSSWASVGWCMGEFCIGTLTDVNIHHCKIRTDRTDKGYGIKALWPDSIFTNTKLYSNDIDLHPTSLWQNGKAPNISIEFAAAIHAGIEIYENKLRNQVSMASHRPTKSGRVLIHNNDMLDMKSNTTAAIELVCSNITVKQNKISGAAMFTGNFQPNGKWVDQIIDDNDFASNGTNPTWGGVFLIGPDGANMNVINNRLKIGNYTLFKHMGNPANSVIVQSGNVLS